MTSQIKQHPPLGPASQPPALALHTIISYKPAQSMIDLVDRDAPHTLANGRFVEELKQREAQNIPGPSSQKAEALTNALSNLDRGELSHLDRQVLANANTEIIEPWRKIQEAAELVPTNEWQARNIKSNIGGCNTLQERISGICREHGIQEVSPPGLSA